MDIIKNASFTVDHRRFGEGLYISRIDGDVVTYDMRTRRPNSDDYMDNITMHTFEHMFSTYIRNTNLDIIYFGPMGCRTGFYLLIIGDYVAKEILPLVRDCFRFIADFEGDVPGASAMDCGNYLDMNLPMAKFVAEKYCRLLENIDDSRLNYPE